MNEQDPNQQQDEAQEQPEAAAPKSKKKLFLISGGLMALLVFGFLGAYLGGVFASDEPADADAQDALEEVNKTLVLDPLVIQLADKGRKPRFVRLSITLGLYLPTGDSGEVGELPEDPLFKPRLQDRLIFAVGAKTSKELGSPEGREALKSELMQKVNQVLPEAWGQVLELYVTEFLIQ